MRLPTRVTRVQATARAWPSIAMALALCACGGGSDAPQSGNPPTGTPPPAPAPTAGLDQRPNNSSCTAPDRPATSVTLSLAPVFPNLTFSSPVALLQPPGDSTRWFVLEQAGRVRGFANEASASGATDFIDIRSRVRSGGEMGLLGMAFHPDFATNGRVFLSYTTGTPLVSRISEFRASADRTTLDAASERIVLSVDQPQTNHNGGGIGFGPDGLLYVGLGDGGGGGDQFGTIGNGQSTRTLLGKMLRIDVDRTTGSFGYGIPADNPFASVTALCGAGGTGTQDCPEIYAWGFRNPWRWSFDRGTGELWVADVGQGAWEEVYRVRLGGNYGWRCREGAHPFNASCGPAQDLIDPVAEYDRAAGFSVTGGYVYRGAALPALQGRYVFGDFGSGRIWHIARDTPPTLRVTASEAFSSGLGIASFAEGDDGELYVVGYGGTLHRLQAAGAPGGATIPVQLSASGCVAPFDPRQPASGLIPYAPNAAFWSDGADKQRWIGLPNGQHIVVGSDGDWDFPNGAVLVKSFRLGQRLVETRLLMRHPDGVWAGYTYEWNEQQTDATRVVGGKIAQVGAQSWIFPSEAQCLACHTEGAGRSLGLETAQLNGNFTYPQTGRTANQLHTLNSIDTLTPALTQAPGALPAIPDPFGTVGTLAERARAYLHTNCAQCHRPGGGTPVDLDLRYATALAATAACNATPQAGSLGIADALIVAPGSAARSVLVARMNRRDANAMPPLASALVDAQGVALVSSWIDGLSNCD